MSFAEIMVIGNLGKDAVVNTLADGKKVINFSVAHSESWMQGGEKKGKTTWFECSKFGEQVKVADFMTKGTQVMVKGTPELRTYTTKDGNAGASIVIRVVVIQLLGGKEDGAAAPQQQAAPAAGAPAAATKQQTSPAAASADDLPF